MRAISIVSAIALGGASLAACGPPGADPDAGPDASCSLAVEVGPEGDPFAPFHDGDRAEVVLGFQGFQMLLLDVRVAGSPDIDRVEISGFVGISETGVEATRIDRAVPVEREGDALRARGWLLFFNEAPVSAIAGHEGELELIVRAGGCVGGARVRLALVDEDACIDYGTLVPDAEVLDAGVTDGAVACGDAGP